MGNPKDPQLAEQNREDAVLVGLKRPSFFQNKRFLFVLMIAGFLVFTLEVISFVGLQRMDRYELRVFEDSEEGGVNGIGVKKKFTQQWRAPEFRVAVRTNNVGFRENQDYFGEKIDIGFYGDSFTFGYGVEQGERYSDLLRACFPGRTIVSFSYLNGWTTPHYYNFMLKYPERLPDTAILGLFLGNDLTIDMDETQIVLGAKGEPQRVIATRRRVERRGFLVSKDRNSLTHLLSKFSFGELVLRSRVLDRLGLSKDPCETNTFPPYSFERGQLTENNLRALHYVEKMNDHLNKHDKRLIVFLIVWAYSVADYPCFHGQAAAVDLRENQYLTNRIIAYLDDNMIEYINPVPRFKELENQGIRLYFEHDAHWNPRGHEAAAELISDYLCHNP